MLRVRPLVFIRAETNALMVSRLIRHRMPRPSATKRYWAKSRRSFRPEFLNRIQEQIVFQPLTPTVLRGILAKLVTALNRRLEDKRITVSLTAEAEDKLIDDGYDEAFGARALERVFDKQISERLAAELLEGRINEGHEVTVGVGDAGFEFRARLLRLASDPK